jgi:hypothetical protein
MPRPEWQRNKGPTASSVYAGVLGPAGGKCRRGGGLRRAQRPVRMHCTGMPKMLTCLAEFSVGSAITDHLEARQIHSSHHSFKRGATNRAIATSSAAHNAPEHHSDMRLSETRPPGRRRQVGRPIGSSECCKRNQRHYLQRQCTVELQISGFFQESKRNPSHPLHLCCGPCTARPTQTRGSQT